MERGRPPRRSAPSWVDRLTDWIDRLPGPSWVPYSAAFIALVLGANAAGWLGGSLAVGSLDPYLSSLAVYPIGALAAIDYLDDQARVALDRLRPVLSVSDQEFDSLRYELTTLPAGHTVASSLIGLAFAVGYAVLGLSQSVRHHGPAVVAFDVAMAAIGFPLLAVFFFHTVRQLRLISRIQRLANIDVFQLKPLLALSGVTARNGLIIVGFAYLSAATDPSTFILTNPTLFAFVAISIVVAIAAFVLPLQGIHERIADEKDRMIDAANRDIQVALARLSSRAQAGDLADADALNKQLSSLALQRDIVAGIPTWPWQAGTLRGFITAVVLPIALWLVFRSLERLLP